MTILRRAGRVWRPVVVSFFVLLAMTGPAAAQASKPAFLTESAIIAAPGGDYEFWYTSTCSDGTLCECDAQGEDLDGDGFLDPGEDVDGNGDLDTDKPNACIATDPDGDGIYDTLQDANNNDTPDLVDPDWAGGGDNTGLVASLPTTLKLALDVYTGDWGLRTPHSREVWIHDLAAWGYTHSDSIEVDTGRMLAPNDAGYGTLTHELWHTIQTDYGSNEGAGDWVDEGQAKMTEDRVFPSFDTNPFSAYLDRVQQYLRNPIDYEQLDLDNDDKPETWQAQGLLDASYNAALWWAYLTEQAGTDFVGTPGEGMDFVKAVLEQAESTPGLTGVAAVDHVLRARINRGFDDTFWDFTIANYAKDVDVMRLDPLYLDGRDPQFVLSYRDEEADVAVNSLLSYGLVKKQLIQSSALQASTGGVVEAFQANVNDQDAMPDYGVKYFEALLPDPAACPLATWQVLNLDGAQLMHSFLLLTQDTNGNGREEVISLARHQGDAFSRGVLNKAEYTRFVGIVATGSEPAGFTWEASCTEPLIEIVEPTTAVPAPVGNPAEPGRFLFWLEVKDGHTTDSVAGLDWQQDFAVTVGGEAATILNGDYVQNQYWLLVQAPNITGAQLGDTYDVEVDLIGTGAADSAADAVIYDLIPKDQILVLDRSGSMANQNRLASAQSATRLYTDAIQQLDQIGVASFSDTAIEEFPLTQTPDQDDAAGVRANAKSAINSIGPGGATSIGAGLRMGQTMLNTDGLADNQPWMLLLSDGMENRAPWVEDVLASEVLPAGTRVQTLALGAGAAEALMHDIARQTCGEILVDYCYHALDNDGLPVSSRAAAAPPNLTNELADIYRRMGETVANHQRLWQDEGQTSGNYVIPLTVAEEGGREAFFSFNWTNPANPLNVTISGPNGVTFTKLSDGTNHVVFFVPQLVSGDYTIALSGVNEWIGSLSARVVKGTEMHAFIDTTEAERKVLLPAHLQVSLSDNDGPVAEATVVATVYRFDKTEETITLRDDGVAPHDAEPHDGVYGYSYDRINGVEAHDITFDITATGAGFNRYQQLTYRPNDTSRPDQNNDGLVDTWQMRYKVLGATEDPDHDGLTNVQEMNLGTDPRYADTDRGGEHDGSEVAHGRNQLAAGDDALPPITDFWCQAHPGAVTLHFNPRAEYGQIRLFRLTNSAPMAPVGIFPPGTGVITDTAVNNGQNYVYFIQALAPGNVRGGYSTQRLCQPDIDPYPPESEIVINDDADTTGSTDVTLRIAQAYDANGAPEITHIKLGNTPDLVREKWQPFAENMPWQLEPDPTTGWASVYALVRDAAGNVSESVLSDGIFYDPALAPLPVRK